jgi:tetratricopeptide (TPR) repeat protein
MSDELMIELGRYGVVRVLRQRGESEPDAAARDRARFAFGARLDAAGDSLRVTAHLTDRWTGHEVWGDEYLASLPRGPVSGSSEDVARVIAARIGAEEGVVVQHLASERRKRRTEGATPYDALLLSYEAFFGRDPETLRLALDALRAVVKADPDCGWAWSRLARLCTANYTLEVTATPTPLEEAIACAEQGVRTDPSSRHARCVLALVLLIKGEPAAARVELERALRSSPDSLAYLEVAGFLLTMLGEWDRGREVLRSAAERNPHCLPSVQLGLWVAHLHRGELEEAHQAALEYRDPMYFLRSAMRASCLGLLGRKDEARLEVDRLLASKPDFATRGRVFVGHYVKSPEVMERIVHGLCEAGLTLD